MKQVLKNKYYYLAAIFFIIITTIILVVPLPQFPDDYSTVILDCNGRMLRVFLASDEQWRCRVLSDSLPRKYQTAVILYEDKRFFIHPGVDPIALMHAAYQCLISRRFVRGASTIPMQIARLSKPKPRTMLNKIIEMIQALKLSLTHSKKSILRIFASHAPMGGNIVGLEAACLRYFGKEPHMLSWAEAAMLAVLPNSPSLIRINKGREVLLKKRNYLLKRIYEKSKMSKEVYEHALHEPLPTKKHDMPFFAPHAARLLFSQLPSQIIISTLDETIQHISQNVVTNYLEEISRYGISNASALVAETHTGKVRAYCGSQSFFADSVQGQVDGIQAPRSTGSLLKPFLYASLLDKGDFLLESKVKDVPTFYGSFIPGNANREYAGMVSIKDALVQSLNVPAARLLSYYGVPRFHRLLRSGGFTTLFRSPGDYGLTLILGGAEATLWEMCGVYRMLGNGGRLSPLVLLETGVTEDQDYETVLSRGSCWLILETLKELHRPGSEYYWHYFENQWPIAWKTGTSYGQRDAWAIGITPQWVIGVWVGNFTGEGNPELAGAKTAGPLMFDIFSRLPKKQEKAWFEKPDDNLKVVRICKETGHPASIYCSETVVALQPLNAESLSRCPYHKVFYMDSAGVYQVCSLCWDEHGGVPDTILVYPPDACTQLRKVGHYIKGIPRHKPDCPTLSKENPITIVYPATGTGLWIPRGITGEKQKAVLKAAHSNAQACLFWYLDGTYLGRTEENHKLAVNLLQGNHQLTLIDDEGHRRQMMFSAGSGL